MQIKVNTLTKTANLPEYTTQGSAGADIRYDGEDVVLLPHTTKLLSTGLSMEIPSGYVGLLCPRSGLSLRTSLRQPNCVGVIDSDYRGEIMGMFENTGDSQIKVCHGDRIVQLLIVPIENVSFVKCSSAEMSSTSRGTGGFGHTGVN